jgi:thiol-disulfide isomerase/thioredoxin
MRLRLPLIITIGLVGGVIAVLSTSGGGGSGTPTIPTSSPAVNATAAPLLPTNALELPDFTSGDFTKLLSQLRGKPVVVNVWGSWCGPCREEGPHLAAAAKEFGRRVQFIGLDVRDEKGPARAFMREMDWTYPSVYDSSSTGVDIERELGFFAQPVTLFFDRDGKLAGQITGPGDATTLEVEIRKILG